MPDFFYPFMQAKTSTESDVATSGLPEDHFSDFQTKKHEEVAEVKRAKVERKRKRKKPVNEVHDEDNTQHNENGYYLVRYLGTL